MPDEKSPSAPVRITHRMSSFAVTSSQASASNANIVSVIAFLRWGRFSVTTITAPSRSISTWATDSLLELFDRDGRSSIPYASLTTQPHCSTSGVSNCV